MPGTLDSLVKFTRMSIRADGDADSLMEFYVNTAIQQVCSDFPAFPKLDTVVFRGDSGGVALNSDIDRIALVQQIRGTAIWLPMGEVSGDTTFLAIVDSSQGSTDEDRIEQPRLWYRHGDLFTQPKHVRDTFALTLQVHYYALDQWITAGTDTTGVLEKYRTAIVDYAAYKALLGLSDYVKAALFLRDYDKKRGVAPQDDEDG